MVRSMMILATMPFLFPSLASCQDAKEKGAPKVEMVPDTKWEPGPGDKANFYHPAGANCFACINLFAFTDMMKFIEAKDNEGLKQMAEKKQLALIPSGTPLLVVKVHENRFIAEGAPALEVRILEGDYKGILVWAHASHVARLVPGPPVKPAKPRPMDPAEKAAWEAKVIEVYPKAKKALAEAKNKGSASQLGIRKAAIKKEVERAATILCQNYRLTREELDRVISEGPALMEKSRKKDVDAR